MKTILLLLTLSLVQSTQCQKNFENDNSHNFIQTKSTNVKVPAGNFGKDSLPDKLDILVSIYKYFLDSADQTYLYWKDGTKMEIDDGKTGKSHDELLENPDLEDMLSQIYISGELSENPPLNFEPGRIRVESFFKKIFGESESSVRSKLVNVEWVDGTQILFSSVIGASDSLKLVVDELKNLPSEFDKYLHNNGGTFVWRNIANTDRLSNHSFGTSIDINTKYADYWLWNKNVTYKNRIPFEIVEIFEKYGFIWGGKWYHYDTMHFEFRPELIIIGNRSE